MPWRTRGITLAQKKAPAVSEDAGELVFIFYGCVAPSANEGD